LQSAKPAAHRNPEHARFTQRAPVAFGRRVQSVPQAPQLVTSSRLASQPLLGSSSQFAWPALQINKQRPSSQLDVATLASRAHTLPHVPQLLGSVRSASQPSLGFELQSPLPALQTLGWQTPLRHSGSAFGKAQLFPQLPQSLLELRSVSQPLKLSPSQLANPSSQRSTTHSPLRQFVEACGSVLHRFPHVPQLVTAPRSVSQPLLLSPSQSALPPAQLGLSEPQLRPQAPQLRGSSFSDWQESPLPHAPKPGVHPVVTHEPPLHSRRACSAAHDRPHAPQFEGVDTASSQPFCGFPSQSLKPLSQPLAAAPG
jgi:hypothetical protein